MGKTADGAVWLNDDASRGADFTRSPYEYWQFWRNTEDADVGKFLRWPGLTAKPAATSKPAR